MHCPMPTKQAHIENNDKYVFLPTLSFPCSWPHTNSQVSPDEPLSLEEFACRTVSVSFVVVNKFGVSRKSPPLTLNVPGFIYTVKPLVLGDIESVLYSEFSITRR